MRAAQIQTVEIVRASIEMQIFGELKAETHVPFRIEEGGAFAERDTGEVEDQAVPVRAADRTVVERAEVNRGACRVRARAILSVI